MVVTKTTKKQTRKACNRCGDVFNVANGFYSISQPDDNFPDEKTNVCKKCYQEAWADEKTGFNAFVDFLRTVNLPYKEELYNSVSKSDYTRRVRLSYANLRFKDSDNLVENKSEIQIQKERLTELTPEQMEECALAWGTGYTEKEYIYLMDTYDQFNTEYSLDTISMRKLVMQLCQLDLKIRRGNEAGTSVKDDLKAYQEVLGNAGLKPAQEKAAAENEANTFGTFIKRIEDEMPIAEPLKEYLDVDGIAKYVKALFTAPMSQSLGVDNPFPDEYEELMSALSIEEDAEPSGDVDG